MGLTDATGFDDTAGFDGLGGWKGVLGRLFAGDGLSAEEARLRSR